MLPGLHQKLEQEQAPAFFARGPSPLARLVFFSTISLILIATDSRLQYLNSVRQNLIGILHPLQVLANAPSELYSGTVEYFSTHHTLLNENQRLRQQALKQNIGLQRLNLLTQENEHLRSLLHANKALVENSIMGEIMHVGRDPFTKKVIVNRGAIHQIVTGEAVVDAAGVIGQITRVYPHSSEVTLITDKSLAIPVQVERNGLRAIAFGRGRNNMLDLPYLPANVEMQEGDRLITSGIDGIYPAGLAVATITKIETSPDSPFARISCKPTGGVDRHKQVLLVSIPQTEILPAQMTTDKTMQLQLQSKAEASIKTTPNIQRQTTEKNIANPATNQPSKPHVPE